MGTDSTSKPTWRRILEVIGPVGLFAVLAPFAVNGLADTINSVGDASIAAAPIVTPSSVSPPPVSAPASSTTDVPEPAVTVAGVDPDADDKTIALATEIVAETASPGNAPAAGSNTTTTTAEADANGDGGHSHGGVTPEVALTRAERSELGEQLAVARDAAMRHPTVAGALAGGYVKVVGYVPRIGSHYIKWASMDTEFDVADPEMLLYDGTEPTSRIVGLSYYVFSDDEPSPFVGANDHWHQHIGLCIKDGVVVGGESLSAADCAARGGTKANAGNGWMVHAWVVPGWDSPEGVFSPEHVGLTADLPTS